MFLPSVGASGDILIAWKGSLFKGDLVFSNDFAISVQFTSRHFNLIRRPENREGGDLSEMLLFIEAISALGLNEVSLQGRKFT